MQFICLWFIIISPVLAAGQSEPLSFMVDAPGLLAGTDQIVDAIQRTVPCAEGEYDSLDD